MKPKITIIFISVTGLVDKVGEDKYF